MSLEHTHTDCHEVEDHDRGLSYDLPTLLSRRRLLALLGGGAGAMALVACGTDAATTNTPGPADTGEPGAPQSTRSGEGIPEETNGPFPADGSNGLNVLTESG